MTPSDFCFWLTGFYELQNPKQLTELQTKIIKDHLDLVFHKITPDYDYPAEESTTEKGT